MPGRKYTIECENYANKNRDPLKNEESIKHFIYSEPPVDIDHKLKYYDENGDINYINYDDYLNMDHN